MKILLISPYFSPAVGGVETHLTDLCKYLESEKHTVYVRTYKALGTKNRGGTDENSKYIKIHRLEWPDFGLVNKLEGYPFLRIPYIATGLFVDCFFFLLANYKNIDVIQVHGFIMAPFALLLAKVFAKKIVVNTHVGFKFERPSLLDKITTYVLRKVDRVLVLTTGAKGQLEKIGVSGEKIVVYHYWVDQNKFKAKDSKLKIKERLGWKDRFIVLFVGRLVEVKGIQTILTLVKRLSNITFVIAGSGPLEEKIQNSELNVKNLIYLGKVDQNKLPDIYNAADLLLIPSKIISQTYEEGIPRVMIEALSCGLPVVSTKSGGIPDVFSNQIGVMVNDDVLDIKQTIAYYFEHKQRLKTLSRNCRKYALANFGMNNAKIIEDSLT